MLRILLVEDNPVNSNMLSRRLMRRGWGVLFAENGRVGIEKAIDDQPDLILMDLSIPEIDGWTATKTLKSDPRTRHIPVIALTAHAMPEDRERAVAAGCNSFETKPVEFTRLAATIETLASAAEVKQS